MAKLQFICVAAALCFLSALIGIAQSTSTPGFVVEGRVYCDTCRAGFETTATKYISGATVKIECRNYATGATVHTDDATTDETGTYKLNVADDHEDEICEVVLVKSPLTGCSEIKVGRDRARIVLTHNSGMVSNVRYANSLGFLKSEPLPECGQLLLQYALADEE